MIARDHACIAIRVPQRAATAGRRRRSPLPPSHHPLSPSLAQLWSVELDEAPVTMALSPKGQLLAVGTVDAEIAVLDVHHSGAVQHRLAGHAGGTNGVAFLGGNSLVSVGEDGRARIWNVVRASCLHELELEDERPPPPPLQQEEQQQQHGDSGRCEERGGDLFVCIESCLEL